LQKGGRPSGRAKLDKEEADRKAAQELEQLRALEAQKHKARALCPLAARPWVFISGHSGEAKG
jgi:hypothetical protein